METASEEDFPVKSRPAPTVWLDLTNREREVIGLRDEGFTLETIALDLGVTRERVRQIEKSGRNKLHDSIDASWPELWSEVARLGPVFHMDSTNYWMSEI